jgi:hypothetical protein
MKNTAYDMADWQRACLKAAEATTPAEANIAFEQLRIEHELMNPPICTKCGGKNADRCIYCNGRGTRPWHMLEIRTIKYGREPGGHLRGRRISRGWIDEGD